MFDRAALAAALTQGPVARVVVAAVHGSTPREAGAAMLVWDGGQSGTIGGGALEFQAVERAREMLAGVEALSPIPSPAGEGRRFRPGTALGVTGHPSPLGEGMGERASGGQPLATRTDRIPLGPALNQCCGGAVTLWTEVWTSLPIGPVIARGPGEMPLAVARILDRARGRGAVPGTALVQGWLIEPVAVPVRQLWVWGAGHVGRAIVATMAPLPDIAVTWVDVAPDRFPDAVPVGVAVIARPDPGAAVPYAPQAAEHLIMTFSHALDLDLCHRLLSHGFATCGLIGSASKAARFRSRLAALGHTPASIARIRCPIGDPSLGKHPQAIAVGVAAAFLTATTIAREVATG